MKLRIFKESGKYKIQARRWFMWNNIYDKRVSEYIEFDVESDAIKFISRYSSYLESKQIVTIDTGTFKSKFPQYFI